MQEYSCFGCIDEVIDLDRNRYHKHKVRCYTTHLQNIENGYVKKADLLIGTWD